MTPTSVPFDPDLHDPSEFSCGEPSLDGWLVTHATAESRRGSARVWVWVDEASTTPTRILGYYSLSASKVARESLPKALGRGGPVEVPAVLIGRLALDASLRGQGLGEVLLADALSRIVEVTRTVGARFVVVGALHERAAVFYERLGFRRLPDSLLLVQKVADIQAAHDA
ncbi:MAG: GNAT family N-acetyltransferase [Mycobacteriales bacterium]